MSPNTITFQDAIAESATCAKRHLLLGNGFSIACKNDIFTYGSIFEGADFSSNQAIKTVFEILGTKDFERVIRSLDEGSRLLQVYGPPKVRAAISTRMQNDARSLKNIFIESLVRNHPKHPSDIDPIRFRSCRKFLEYFLGTDNKGGKVYTLNYDLLLYWTLMQDELLSGGNITLATDDGFGREELEFLGDWDTDWNDRLIVWKGESSAAFQRVHYLHGALHLFDTGAELKKNTWSDTGVPLRKQAEIAIEHDMFPLFVAEGESEEKLDKIKHSAYLYHSYKSFSRQMEQARDALFVFGHSMADNDGHILRKISGGRISNIYVSVFGDLNDKHNVEMIANANRLKSERLSSYPLGIKFFDAESSQVWG